MHTHNITNLGNNIYYVRVGGLASIIKLPEQINKGTKFTRTASTKRKMQNLKDLPIYDLQIVTGMPWNVNLTKPSMWWFPKSLSDSMVVSLASHFLAELAGSRAWSHSHVSFAYRFSEVFWGGWQSHSDLLYETHEAL